MPENDSRTSRPIEENRIYHTRYLRAINSPTRREILRALTRGKATLEDLQSITGLSRIDLEWHLAILEYGFCVKRENEKNKLIYKLTQEGRVIDHMG